MIKTKKKKRRKKYARSIEARIVGLHAQIASLREELTKRRNALGIWELAETLLGALPAWLPFSAVMYDLHTHSEMKELIIEDTKGWLEFIHGQRKCPPRQFWTSAEQSFRDWMIEQMREYKREKIDELDVSG